MNCLRSCHSARVQEDQIAFVPRKQIKGMLKAQPCTTVVAAITADYFAKRKDAAAASAVSATHLKWPASFARGVTHPGRGSSLLHLHCCQFHSWSLNLLISMLESLLLCLQRSWYRSCPVFIETSTWDSVFHSGRESGGCQYIQSSIAWASLIV